MSMHRALWTLLIGGNIAALTGCAADAPRPEQEGGRGSNQFFENAQRRDATAAEASRVGQLTTSQCASFFLENTANKTFVATARHCVDFAITAWCANDGALVDNSGHAGKCTRVVAADTSHDIAVFEAALAHPTKGDATLRLAAYVPPLNTKLIMTGYPADEDPLTARRGKLTTTANCWILSGAVTTPYPNETTSLDVSARHNCSTYGGNSGGPMYLEGTREAIGLPFTYLPDDYNRYSSTDVSSAAYLALMAGFVSNHAAELAAAGIVISNGPNSPPTPVDPPPPPAAAPPADETIPASDETSDTTSGDDPASDDVDAPPAATTKKKRVQAEEAGDGAAPAASASSCSVTRPRSASRSAGAGAVSLAVTVAFVALALRRRRRPHDAHAAQRVGR